MKRGALLLKMCVLIGMTSTALSVGCAHGVKSESTVVRQATWQADLDDCREVSLSVERVHDRAEGQPDRTYERLALKVRPRRELEFEAVVKSIEMREGVPAKGLAYDEIEVRADELRRRVWFIDRDTGRVIATLDRDTGVTTGPDDEQPSWATPHGGVVLESLE